MCRYGRLVSGWSEGDRLGSSEQSLGPLGLRVSFTSRGKVDVYLGKRRWASGSRVV